MNAIKLAQGYRLQWEEAQKSHVLLYPEGMIKLNDTASEILNLVDGERNEDDIIRALEGKFPGVELAPDVREFIQIARQNRWLD